MSEMTGRTAAALRWGGRLLAVGGVIVGMTAGRQTAAIVVLVVGVAAMVAGQIIGWRGKSEASGS